jgi:hypothetical protein
MKRDKQSWDDKMIRVSHQVAGLIIVDDADETNNSPAKRAKKQSDSDAALALSLQQQYVDDSAQKRAASAHKLHPTTIDLTSEEPSSSEWCRIAQTKSDQDIARALAASFRDEAQIPKADGKVEAASMMETPTGKAWKFVEGVLKIH